MQAAAVAISPTFRPLPEGLTVAPSSIEGLGLFTEVALPAKYYFGRSHVFTDDPDVRTLYPDGWVRSPWGAWYNMNPDRFNCETIHHGDPSNPQPDDYKELRTLRAIRAGEELIVGAYSLYIPVP